MRGAFGPGSITGLVWVPVLLAVIAEVSVAPVPLTLQLWAACTSRSYYCIAVKKMLLFFYWGAYKLTIS